MANGDMTLTTPKTISITGLTLVQMVLSLATSTMQIVFQETATGVLHSAQLTDASCIGFDLTAGVFTDSVPRAVTGEYTKLLGILFGAGASTPAQRKTAAVQALVTDGIVTVACTVA
jgi:hypothetical protein